MITTRSAARACAAGIALVLTVAACGDGSGDPAAEQELTVGVDALPVSLDAQENSAESTVTGPVQHVLEPLVKREDAEFIPALAESWENPDELTWVFHIDPDATFSDGTPVTADDARASLERLIEIGGTLAPLFAEVESIEATDEATLTITTSQPVGTLLTSLSLVLVGQAAGINDPEYWQSPVGSGPFTVEEYTVDQRLVLAKNADYWGEPASLDSITYVGMPEETALISALSTGEVDVIGGISADLVAEVESMDGIVYETVPNYQTQFIWFNSAREPFNDIRVRQALWHAVDLEQIVPDLYGDQAEVATAPVAQSVLGAPTLEPYQYDPDLARELLEQAGYPDGFSTSIQFSNAGGDLTLSFVQAVVSAWAEVGVNVEPLPKEHANWLDDLVSLNWDMNTQNASTTTGDADYALGRLYTCAADRLGYCNEEFDRLVADAKASIDQEHRDQLYQQAAQILWDDAAAIFVADKTTNVAYHDYVENVHADPAGRQSFADVSIGSD